MKGYACGCCGVQVIASGFNMYDAEPPPGGGELALHQCPPLNLDDLHRALHAATRDGPVEHTIAHVERGHARYSDDAIVPGIDVFQLGPTSAAERKGTLIPQSVLDVMRRERGATKANREQ